jgi:hypothetical protein
MDIRAIGEQVAKEIENPSNRSVPAEFFKQSVQNKLKTLELKTPVFEDVTFIRFYVDRLSRSERPARQEDFLRYKAQYEAFLNNQKQKESGVPIGMLPAITPSEIDNLESKKIFTIERLADISESIIASIGYGARDLQARAKTYLQQSNVSAIELKKAQNEIEELRKQIATLMEKQNEPFNANSGRGKRNKVISETANSGGQ